MSNFLKVFGRQSWQFINRIEIEEAIVCTKTKALRFRNIKKRKHERVIKYDFKKERLLSILLFQ